uniref:Regulation of nuclear pre-mRNA domain-containing protein 2 n=1 Tax=Latimeria chalumnae TaxID=7897 RepID=H3AN60_LATCH
MAAGGGSSRGSFGALEGALDRKLQTVTNTMESIQGLSSWCVENKKHHSSIVQHWLKCLRRSDYSHRLNLFYVANDVIQTCKRRNAIVFRESFASVLPEAAALVKDASIRKSVERIFTIWEERNVYPEETIASFKAGLGTNFFSAASLVSDNTKEKKAKYTTDSTAVTPKAALKSKIVAEFRPQALIDRLLAYKHSEDQVGLKEKQLATMRVDVCSTETLKRLKDKAGGKKFSKDFEEASSKLEEFVTGLDKQVKTGPPLVEALENAAVFYEAQYKEVKVVANAYKTFANRVSNLKKKLDQLKASLPDPEESPIPSPSIDAPSPTGSESPFQGMGAEEKGTPEVQSPLSPVPVTVPPEDNRDVEDMELSEEEEVESTKIIVEERKEKQAAVSTSAPLKTTDSVSKTPPAVTTPAKTQITTATTTTPSTPLPLPNLANVDLAKISSILSSLTNAVKNTGVSPGSKVSPGTPTTPTTLAGGLKTPTHGPPAVQSNPLANILSKVEITPESILSVLSKTQGSSAPALQGLSSLLQSVAGSTALSINSTGISQSTSTSSSLTPVSSLKDKSVLSAAQPVSSRAVGYSPSSSTSEVSSTSSVSKNLVGQSPALSGSSFKPPTTNPLGFTNSPHGGTTPLPLAGFSETPKPKLEQVEAMPSSLELKIHNFLKGNPNFNALNLNIPILSNLGSTSSLPETRTDFQRGPTSTSMDNVDGTPVRDESGGTPTQDEMMDKPTSSNIDPMSLLSKIISPGSSTSSSTNSSPQNRESGYSKELSNSVHTYKPFGRGENLSPSAYRQPSDTWEKPTSLTDSPQEKFYPDTSFQEDEDYRDFRFSGLPPAAVTNLEKKPAKSILKSSKASDVPAEYQPIQTSYSQRAQELGVKSGFLRPVVDQNEGYGSQPSLSSDVYGGYAHMGGEVGADRSSSPSTKETFFTPDSNHDNLSKVLSHTVLPQKQFPDSPLSGPLRQPISNQAVQPLSVVKTLTPSLEKNLSAAISATSTIEFKNMLKNASRKPSDDKQSEQGPKSGANEGENAASLSHFGVSHLDPPKSEEHYRIETRVSSSCSELPDSTEEKGTPIESIGSATMLGNRRMSGEPIQTVESIRVIGKGNRGHGRDGARGGWFEHSFDKGSSGASETLPAGGSGGVTGFTAHFEEHIPPFQDNINSFRVNSFSSSFEQQVHHGAPPPVVPPVEHGVPPFQREQPGLPPVPPVDFGGPPLPPPNPPVDHPSLFPRELPVPPLRPPVDHTSPFPNEPPPPLPMPPVVPPPPPPPPPVELGGVPFPKELGVMRPGTVKESFSMHLGALRERPLLPPPHRDNGPLGQVQENLVLPTPSVDHHPPPPLPHGGPGLGPGLPHRDRGRHGGMVLRNPRPDFRPREPFFYREPFPGLKRPRMPFGGGPPFYAPKRPFLPPRY